MLKVDADLVAGTFLVVDINVILPGCRRYQWRPGVVAIPILSARSLVHELHP